MAGSNAGGGCLGVVVLFLIVFVGLPAIYVGAIEPALNPAAAEARREASAAKEAEKQARIGAYNAARDKEERVENAEKEAEAEASRQQTAANAAASERATIAALERYADCTVRNRTPNGCYEDWRPTPEARAMVETMQ